MTTNEKILQKLDSIERLLATLIAQDMQKFDVMKNIEKWAEQVQQDAQQNAQRPTLLKQLGKNFMQEIQKFEHTKNAQDRSLQAIAGTESVPSLIVRDALDRLWVLEIPKILFFWQKIVPDEIPSAVTQIVYKTGEKNDLIPDSNAEQLSDVCLQASSYIYQMSRHWAVKDRRAIDVSVSLDELRDGIVAAVPTQKFVIAHRAFTNQDNRVFILFPSFSSLFESAVNLENNLPCNIRQQDIDQQVMRLDSAGGGGHVEGLPNWLLATHDRFGIQLIETNEHLMALYQQVS